jgi:hypothetical protein
MAGSPPLVWFSSRQGSVRLPAAAPIVVTGSEATAPRRSSSGVLVASTPPCRGLSPLANRLDGSKTVIVSDASGVGAPTWSWVVVHQAIGMTMEYLDCSGLAAFEALMTRAAATGQTLSDLSCDVVERRFRFPAARS